MAMQKQWRLQTGPYLGEISALCFLRLPPQLSSFPFLLAGAGSQMLLYDLEAGKTVRSFHVFEGIRIHGIACSLTSHEGSSQCSMLDFKVAVYGERRLKLFNLSIQILPLTLNEPSMSVDFVLHQLLPKFPQWVLDVAFLKGYSLLAVGCSDNSVFLWDIQRSGLILHAICPERCLLYSMRLWGEELEDLCIASGTIYNEIIVWRVVKQSYNDHWKDDIDCSRCLMTSNQLNDQQYASILIRRLIGHEGSIFRIAWSSDGSKLVSVSDDRSARIWAVYFKQSSCGSEEDNSYETVGHELFGHNARIWDCCITDSLIITAGEDCTTRVWGLDGKQVKMIKEHIGRGIWRCLYDPISSVLITAGFDSAVKVHQLYAPFRSSGKQSGDLKDLSDRTEIRTAFLPNSSTHPRLMDSKSEYIRCLRFAYEDAFYVTTNHGYLYHAKLVDTGVKWTQLVQVSPGVPIVCMDILPGKLSKFSSYIDDWITVGDGQGRVTAVNVGGDVSTPKVSLDFGWSAEVKRRLLGTFWCKSLGHRYVLTADPKGMLKLWKLSDSQKSVSGLGVSLVAKFESCFGVRIMCLDASFDEELLVCGDLRGNMILFPLPKSILVYGGIDSEVRISQSCYFKGAHGISAVSSISITASDSSQVDICSTGGDGCICYMEYNKGRKNLDFTGMKQLKELSLIETISPKANYDASFTSNNYVIGFASTDFIIWSLVAERKVLQVPCGGWRRPHAYFVGDVAEMRSCFAYVKDETIYIHRNWVLDNQRKMFPQNLHMQFHGREIHCLRFVSRDIPSIPDDLHPSGSTFIATGCEDGTVRLTRHTLGLEDWSASKLLGEHVGGSAVRSICFVSKMHTIANSLMDVPAENNGQISAADDIDSPFLLISVGAKRVLTSWLLGNRTSGYDASNNKPSNGTRILLRPSSRDVSPMNFKWLSTDMPTKYLPRKAENSGKIIGSSKKDDALKADAYENDWRYLAVTSFLVKIASSRFTVCFVVIACSDATLVLRALVLPCRLWFDVAVLAPLSSPVLTLQHVTIPVYQPSEDSQIGSAFIVISGSTDGSIAFWDLSLSVTSFTQKVSAFLADRYFDCQNRPRTGRGSQGGRLRKSLDTCEPKRNTGGEVTSPERHIHISESLSKLTKPNDGETVCSNSFDTASFQSEAEQDEFVPEIKGIQPLHLQNNVHQSGVNCLHVSEVKDGRVVNSVSQYIILSGGDDQSVCCIGFDLALVPTAVENGIKSMDVAISKYNNTMKFSYCDWGHRCQIRFLYHKIIASAHTSAVKGIWTDGNWAFSVGLDQRVRCWQLEHGKLTEHDHLIVCVPEPEALDARACGNNNYQITVAGRGMQMLGFSKPGLYG